MRTIGWVVVFSLIIVLVGGLFAAPHGLTRTRTTTDGATTVDRWAWLRLDGADFARSDLETNVTQLRYDGYIAAGTSRETVWQITYTGALRLIFDGRTLIDAPGRVPTTTVTVPVAWQGDFAAVELETTFDLNAISAGEAAHPFIQIAEPDALGIPQPLPSYRLYQSPGDHGRETAIFTITRTAMLITLSAAVIGLVKLVWNARRRRDFWIGAGIVVLAFVVRLVVLQDRAAADPLYTWLPPGGDDNYVLMAREVLTGVASLAGTFHLPGNILWMMTLQTVFGTQLETLYLVNTVVSALSVSAVTAAGWLAFGRRAGIIAGIIAALYPPLIFYQATLQTAPLDTTFAALAALVGFWTLSQDGTPRQARGGAVVYGVVTGVATLFRASSALIGVAFFLTLLSLYRWRDALVLTSLAALTALLILAPQTLANLSVGEVTLVSTNGPPTLYAGNNRDSDGTWPSTVAARGYAYPLARLEGADWTGALMDDLRANPIRMGELLLRKVGLFWSNAELSHNVDYQMQGLDLSPLLRALSLNGLIGMAALASLAFIGLVIALTERRSLASVLLFWSIVMMVIGAALFLITGRMRAPVLPLLAVAAGVGVDGVLSWLTKPQARTVIRLAAVGVCAALFLVVMQVWADTLPRRPVFTGELPAEVTHKNAVFGDQIELVGAAPLRTDYQRYLYVTLYWRALQPLPTDYRVFVELATPDGRAAGVDVYLGAASYPVVYTSEWAVNETIAESYLIMLPEALPEITSLNVGVYDEATGQRLALATGADFAQLTSYAVMTDSLSAQANASSPEMQLGDVLGISAVTAPAEAQAGEAVRIEYRVQALRPTFTDYTVFIHLFDTENTLVAQIDSPILDGDWKTSALIPGYPITAASTLEIPADLPPGSYRLVLGAYPYPDLTPLPPQGEIVFMGHGLDVGMIEIE